MFDSSLPLASVVLAALWLVLSAIVAAGYPAVKAMLPKAPKSRATALLILCSGPLFVSLAISVLLFTPNRLIDPHCHAACAPHVPAVLDDIIEWGALTWAALLGGSLLFFICTRVLQARRLGQILNFVASGSGAAFSVVDSSEPLAVSMGLFRPKVLISNGLMQSVSRAELTAIVEHEQAHCRRRDNLKKLLAFCGTIPSLLRKRLRADLDLALEQCCDAAAARALGDPPLVAQTLIRVQKLARQGAREDRSGFDGANIEARVNALLQPPAEFANPGLVVVLAVAVIGLIMLTPAPLHHQIEKLLDGLHLLLQ